MTSLRFRLVLLSWLLATGSTLVLTAALHARSERQLMDLVDGTLGRKCEEVLTVLASDTGRPTLEQFLRLESSTRSSPYVYFYELRDASGHPMARSSNLRDRELPWPESWSGGERSRSVRVDTVPDPVSPAAGRIRVRSERVPLPTTGGGPAPTVVIQSAASLAPFEGAVRRSLRESIAIAAAALAIVFGLLWTATTHSLRPVAAMTRAAFEIGEPGRGPDRFLRSGRQDEIDRLAAALNAMLDRLTASLRKVEQYSSDVAHQLRTPLTRIHGALETALCGDVSSDVRQELSKAVKDVDGLARVCREVLLLARLDRPGAAADLLNDTVALADVVAELVEQTEPAARDKGVSLVCMLPAPVSVRGNRPLLVQAILNLLDAALRATPPGGAITISCAAHGEMAGLSIQDSGPGIPPDERERIFEPFHRPARPPQGAADNGGGLGLAIVRRIVQVHGGRIEIEEPPAGGSTFCIVLPLVPAAGV